MRSSDETEAQRQKRPWRTTHVKQETRKERRERKRYEAQERCGASRKGHKYKQRGDTQARCYKCGDTP